MLCNEGPKTDEYMKCLNMESEGHSVVTIMPHDVKMGVREALDDKRVAYLSERIAFAQRDFGLYWYCCESAAYSKSRGALSGICIKAGGNDPADLRG